MASEIKIWRATVLTLFPEMFPGPLGVSLAGRALAVGLWSAVIAGASVPDGTLWLVAARELVVGATIGVVAALPLIAAATAGRRRNG